MEINPALSQSHSAAVYRIMQYQQQHRCNNSIIPTEKKTKQKNKMSRKFSVPRWTATHTTCTTATTAILNILTTFILSAATADVFLHKTPDGIILDMVYSNAFPSATGKNGVPILWSISNPPVSLHQVDERENPLNGENTWLVCNSDKKKRGGEIEWRRRKETPRQVSRINCFEDKLRQTKHLASGFVFFFFSHATQSI